APRPRGVPKPSTTPSFRPRQPPSSTPNYVTQTQLEASLARVDGKIKTAGDGISALTARVTALAASYKKDTEERKKSVEGQSKDLNQKLQLLALLPMLVQPSSRDTTGVLSDANGKPIDSILVPDTNKLNLLLPVLLVSGMGGAGGLSVGGDGSGDNSMMMMALALAIARP